MINYKSLLVKNSINYPDIKRGLDIVSDYIKKNRLILVGGMAIDYALRLKGDSIYDEFEIPDYDMYSADNYQDAINIGKLLCEANLPNISIIRGFHMSTMRVRVNFEPVADITYCPKSVFDRIPTLTYEKFLIIHPLFQYIDQHNALAYPYRNPQWGGNIFRWKKDIKRLELLQSYYPIPTNNEQREIETLEFDLMLLTNLCIGGYAAHSILSGDYSIKKNKLILDLLKREFMVYTNDFIETIKTWEKYFKTNAIYYNAYLTQLPRYAVITNENVLYIIVDNQNEYLASVTIDNINVCGVNCILLYYLQIQEYHGYNLAKQIKLDYHFPISYYGTNNKPETVEFNEKLFDNPMENNLVPKNLYPKKEMCEISSSFLYDSIYFQLDGGLS